MITEDDAKRAAEPAAKTMAISETNTGQLNQVISILHVAWLALTCEENHSINTIGHVASMVDLAICTLKPVQASINERHLIEFKSQWRCRNA